METPAAQQTPSTSVALARDKLLRALDKAEASADIPPAFKADIEQGPQPDHDDDDTPLLRHLKSLHADSSSLAEFSIDELELLASHMVPMPFTPEQVVLRSGELGGWVGIVLNGTLVSKGGEVPTEIGRGEMLGARSFFLPGSYDNPNIHAADGGLLAIMRHEQTEALLQGHPLVAAKLLRTMAASALESQPSAPSQPPPPSKPRPPPLQPLSAPSSQTPAPQTRQQQRRISLEQPPPTPNIADVLRPSPNGGIPSFFKRTSWKTEIERVKAAAGYSTADSKLGDSKPAAADFWDATHTPSPLSAFCGTFAGLGGLMLGQHVLHVYGVTWGIGLLSFTEHDVLLFIGAFGALSALLYGAPAAPLGSQRATIIGFIIITTLTMALRYASMLCEYYIGVGLPAEVEMVLAPALGIAALLLFKQAIHPPAAACAIQYMGLKKASLQGPSFLLAPALTGAVWLLLVQLAVAKAVRYHAAKTKAAAAPPPPTATAVVTAGTAAAEATQEPKGGTNGGTRVAETPAGAAAVPASSTSSRELW